ncbi:MAG: type II toxin-antitoxin system RelE family toxin [Myxococcaceae bacterium]
MKKYVIEVSRTAEKQLGALGKVDRERVIRHIRNLAENPRPSGCRQLSGYSDVFRIRVGDYRIIYTIEDRTVTVAILKIGHRREVYR